MLPEEGSCPPLPLAGYAHEHASFMRDASKRTYGTEFVIFIFYKVYEKNIRIFRKHESKTLNFGQDTIFEVYNMTLKEDYTTHFFYSKEAQNRKGIMIYYYQLRVVKSKH